MSSSAPENSAPTVIPTYGGQGSQQHGSGSAEASFANNEPVSSDARRSFAFVGSVDIGKALDEFGPNPDSVHGAAEIRHLRLRDAQSASEVLRYLRADADSNPNNHLRRWGDTPPTVRLVDGATADDMRDTMNAVRLLNSALPASWQLRVDTTLAARDGALNPGFIEVAFDPRETWPTGTAIEDRVGVAVHRYTSTGRMTAAAVLVDPNRVTGEGSRIGVLLHELLHTLGRGHVSPTAFPATIMHAYDLRASDWLYLNPLDEAALYAVYDRLQPGTSGNLSFNDLGPWSEVSTHVFGRLGHVPGRQEAVLFGAVWRYGQVRPWAIGRNPSPPLTNRLSGSASWSGRMIGLTPQAEAVAGAMGMSLQLSSLNGSLYFTDLEKWASHAAPGALGTGTQWGDGDLHYGIAVPDGTFITETGGDEGQITGVFFGSNHERVGGTLRRRDLAAGFGGKR